MGPEQRGHGGWLAAVTAIIMNHDASVVLDSHQIGFGVTNKCSPGNPETLLMSPEVGKREASRATMGLLRIRNALIRRGQS